MTSTLNLLIKQVKQKAINQISDNFMFMISEISTQSIDKWVETKAKKKQQTIIAFDQVIKILYKNFCHY